MPASYPASVKSFVTRVDGAGNLIMAAHVNDLQDEVNAIEDGLINGIEHVLRADATNTRDLGTSAVRWRDYYGKQINLDPGTITADAQQVQTAATWNAGAVTFVHKDANVTDTASAVASLLERWRVGGAVRMSLRKDGLLTLNGTGAGIDITAGANASIGTGDGFDLILERNNVNKIQVGASEVVFVDPIRAAAGSASLPGFTFSTDTNTGMYRFGEDAIGFATGGGARMNLDGTALNLDSAVRVRMSSQNRMRYLNALAQVTKSAAQSIATAAFTAVTWNAEDLDTDTLHDTVTNNSRLTAQLAGKYLVWATVTFAGNATGTRIVRLTKNGATNIGRGARVGGHADANAVTGVWLVSLAATDYVEVEAYQDSGAGLNVVGNDTEQGISAAGMVYLGE